MRQSMLKYSLYFPRCLIDGVLRLFRSPWGKKKNVITCSKCGIMYSRAAIKDADPKRWERVRERELFKVWVDGNGRRILQHQGLGSRRIANPNIIEGPSGARTRHV